MPVTPVTAIPEAGPERFVRQLREACLARAGIDVRFLSGAPGLRRAMAQLAVLPATERLLVVPRVGSGLVPASVPPAATRVMVPPGLASGSARERLRAVSEAGVQVRVSAQPVRRLAIVDRTVAVADLGSGSAGGEPDGVRIHNAELVGTLLAYFEGLWRQATPLSDPVAASLKAFTARQRLVLELLAAGSTDDLISREIGLSPRAVRGEVAAIREILGASSRFQAGLRYAALLG